MNQNSNNNISSNENQNNQNYQLDYMNSNLYNQSTGKVDNQINNAYQQPLDSQTPIQNINDVNNKRTIKSKVITISLIAVILLTISIIILLTKKAQSNSNTSFRNQTDVGKYMSLVSDSDNDKKVSVGDKYTYKVNDKDTFNFYVLSIEDDVVNLIMDRNICEDGTPTNSKKTCACAWYDDEDSNYSNASNNKGPITAMKCLYNGTKDWTNVPNMNLVYNDVDDQKSLDGYSLYLESTSYGYGGVEIKNGKGSIIEKNGKMVTIELEDNKLLKTRLPKYSEIKKAELNEDDNILPFWLVENIRYYDTTNHTGKSKYALNKNAENQSIYGYWLISSNCAIKEYGRNVESIGLTMYQSVDTYIGSGYGVRPVITVSKDSISNIKK